MIKSIDKICTACYGLGEIEGIQKIPRNPQNKLDIPVEEEVPRDSNECYVCRGKGFIPTGFFIFEDEGKTFTYELEELDEELKLAIKNRI